MPLIPSQLPIEITSKYSVANNAFKLGKIVNAEKDIYTNEPKDEINVIVGDDKQPDTFIPQVKLQRWSNEVNFSVRLIDNQTGKETITTEADKIKWSKGNLDIEYYDYEEGEGGYKMVWYLKKKPKTNKVEFTIQSKGLDFFYQSALTEQYQSGWNEEYQQEIVVTETQVKDLEGNVLVERPENVVGSYAVYHQTKGGMNDINGKEYKVGKAFHIYRPHIIDAEGKETWGILNIENGIYSVEIPQEFLDTCKFPLKSNDNFGYESKGGTVWGAANAIRGDITYNPGVAGTITSITCCVKDTGTQGNMAFGVYASDDSLVDNSDTWLMTAGYDNWKTINSQNQSFTSDDLRPVFWSAASGSQVYGDSRGTGTIHYDSETMDSVWPDPWAHQTYSPTTVYETSIYATYTPAAGTRYDVGIVESGSGGGTGLVLQDTFSKPLLFSRKAITDILSLVDTFLRPVIIWRKLASDNLVFVDGFSLPRLFWRKSNSDVLSLVDNSSIQYRFLNILSDTISLIEDSIIISFFRKSFDEVISFIDLFSSPLRQLVKSLQETIILVESYVGRFFSRVYNTSLITVLDTASALRRFVQSAIETITLNRVVAAIHAYTEAITDTIVFNELLALISRFNLVLSGTISLNEVFSKIAGFIKGLAETIGLSDAISSVRGLYKSLIDTIAIADTISKIQGFVTTITDVISFAEIVVANILTTLYTAVITEVISLTEAVSNIRAFRKTETDTISLTETVSFPISFFRSFTEAISLNEIVNYGANFVKNVSDAIKLSDVVSWGNTFFATLSETIASSEIFSIVSSFWASFTEAISLEEILETRKRTSESITETITLVDSKILMWIMSLTDVIQLTSAIERITSKWRVAFTEAIELVETWFIPGTWWNNLTKHTAVWAEQAKNTAIWSQLTKNTSAWNKQAKNTATWSKQTKNPALWTNVEGVRKRRE